MGVGELEGGGVGWAALDVVGLSTALQRLGLLDHFMSGTGRNRVLLI